MLMHVSNDKLILFSIIIGIVTYYLFDKDIYNSSNVVHIYSISTSYLVYIYYNTDKSCGKLLIIVCSLLCTYHMLDVINKYMSNKKKII